MLEFQIPSLLSAPPKAPSTVAALTKLGVAFPEGAKKADLKKLYAESQAPKE
ncbi:MAG: hypothetical protein PVJ98_03225 [Akkermansiaceae bacterium]